MNELGWGAVFLSYCIVAAVAFPVGWFALWRWFLRAAQSGGPDYAVLKEKGGPFWCCVLCGVVAFILASAWGPVFVVWAVLYAVIFVRHRLGHPEAR